GRQQELVVIERGTPRERHGLFRTVDVFREIVHDLYAEAAQFVIAMTLLLEGAQPAEMQVGERTRIETLHRLNERHLQFGIAALEIFRGRGTAESAADNDNATACALRNRRHGQRENAGTCAAEKPECLAA